ncbi:hypothetical protein [Chryseosolibacter histidini]|uniref:hypothetical protein n=1 Tax=Chryseosolibacter histidini TaxID=2782349 RepID=UPI0020B1D0E8|nr:hypothetical protein [Chryseosolibacter histidini]
MRLTADHISYIVRDLRYRGIVHDELENELTDHIATCVENEMASGKNFIEAYHTCSGRSVILRGCARSSAKRSIQKIKNPRLC